MSEPPVRVLPLREVESMVGLRKTAIYNAIKHDGFPRPIKLTPRKSGWFVAEVADWLQRRADARQ